MAKTTEDASLPAPDMSHAGTSATWPSKQSDTRQPPGVVDKPDEKPDGPPPGLSSPTTDAVDKTTLEINSFANVDYDPQLDMASWKTNDGWNSWGSAAGGMAPPGNFGYGGMMPSMMPPMGMPPMGPMGMMDPSMLGMMPNMGAMIPGGQSSGDANGQKSENELKLALQAAELDVKAAQLKQAALQAEMEAQLARSKMSGGAPMQFSGTAFGEAYTGFGGAASAFRPPADAKAKKSSKEKKEKQAKDRPATTVAPEDQTTLMLKNIPNGYIRDMIVELLDTEGFVNNYDFIYLPMDLHRMAGLGYAFVNFVNHNAALRAKTHFEGFKGWKVNSQKICEVTWGDPLQGLEAHVERYRNSPVMHEDVPDKYKPAQYNNGVRVDLPPPTKRIRPPRIKKAKGEADGADVAGGEGDDAADDDGAD